MILDEQDQALVALGRTLAATGYRFITGTPETHRRMLKRDARRARDLRDVFGWSRRFELSVVPERVRALAQRAGVFVEREAGLFQASVRFSCLGEHLFVHSAFPTLASDAVFFGPDTYRFCDFVRRSGLSRGRVVDVGCGTGAGGIVCAGMATTVVLSDISALALRFARVNAELAGMRALEIVESDVLANVSGPIDAVIANPPYMLDASQRLYRNGGGARGEGLSLRIARESLARLAPGGRLVLYTGAAIIAGHDALREQLAVTCRDAGATFCYQELDPDVFGEQLEESAYEGVERIAAVGLLAVAPSGANHENQRRA